MKKYTVLTALDIAMNKGFCGIANENRLVFKMLSAADNIQPSGLLLSPNVETLFSRYQKTETRDEALAQANRFFHESLKHAPTLKAKILRRLIIAKYFFLNKSRFGLYDVDSVFQNTIWRRVFDRTLSPMERDDILANNFYYSDLTELHMAVGSYFKRTLHLDTTNHDFALFLEPTPITVSPGTIKVVRYHDAIPLVDPDFTDTIYSQRTHNMLQMCAQDSYFVCNSEPTRDVLLQLKPELEHKTFTIPAAVTNNYKKVQDADRVRQIMQNRLSTKIVSYDSLTDVRAQLNRPEPLKYIFNMAALDPKKNHITLIRAFEQLNYQYGSQLKLVVAANRGWLSAEIEEAMRPHILQGNLIHLDNVPSEDVPYLHSHAEAFIFPSYTEGFGLPPVEALQCECPVIASDIPAHRWVLGDAVLYCDPYNAESLRAALEQLVYAPNAATLRQSLAQKGLQQIKRYGEEELSQQWMELFDLIGSKS